MQINQSCLAEGCRETAKEISEQAKAGKIKYNIDKCEICKMYIEKCTI